MNMKLFIIAALFTFSYAVMADFDMYHGQFHWAGGRGDKLKRDIWQVYQTDPDCSTVLDHTPITDSSSDVSGNKLGVRCEGRGCSHDNDPSEIDVLEMHFSNNPLYHWSKSMAQFPFLSPYHNCHFTFPIAFSLKAL